MEIYVIYKHTDFEDIKTSSRVIRPDFGMYYIKTKYFDKEFDAGKYIGSTFTKDEDVFIDKTKAYEECLKRNKKLITSILNEFKM